jgi:glycosyltransferase involved in cell wall biosynthesis
MAEKQNSDSVSVVTVCLDSERTIERTMLSVLGQTRKPKEYIVIDGRSQDRTLEVIRRFEERFHDAGIGFQIVSEHDRNMYDAMNKGIARATGDLIGIINSDDWYDEDAISNVMEAYGTSGEAVYYGMLRIYKHGKLYLVRQYSDDFLSEQMIQHPTMFVASSIYKKYGDFDTRYEMSADYELINRLKKEGVPFVRIEKPMANFSEGGAGKRDYRGQRESLEIQREYGHVSRRRYCAKIASLLVKSFITRKKMY